MDTRTPQDIEHSAEKLLHDLKVVVQDGEELLRASAHDLSERGMAAREKLLSALQAAQETRRRLEERARDGMAATDRAIRDRPYGAMGIALALGLLLGMLSKR